jgi:hypothetical protein
VIVDGYEQLGKWARLRLKWFCRRRGVGLLVTAHESVGLPTLYQTSTSVALAEAVAGRLLRGDWSRVSRDDVSQRYAACQGNLRDMLFDLYDLYERRRGAESEGSVASDQHGSSGEPA